MITLSIPGHPIAWDRPGQAHVGNKVWTYDTQKPLKERVRWIMRQQWNSFFDCPNAEIAQEAHKVAKAQRLIVSLVFVFPIKDRCSYALQNAKLWGWQGHIQTPDWDNLCKFYMDCGNRLLWSDDKIVEEAHARKTYGKNPRTIIKIMTKDNFSNDPKVQKILEVFGPSKLEQFSKDVKKFDYLSKEEIIRNCAEGEGVDKWQWQQRTAVLLAQFASDHSHDLAHINKYKAMIFKG